VIAVLMVVDAAVVAGGRCGGVVVVSRAVSARRLRTVALSGV